MFQEFPAEDTNRRQAEFARWGTDEDSGGLLRVFKDEEENGGDDDEQEDFEEEKLAVYEDGEHMVLGRGKNEVVADEVGGADFEVSDAAFDAGLPGGKEKSKSEQEAAEDKEGFLALVHIQ